MADRSPIYIKFDAMLELSPKDTIHLCNMSPSSLCFLASWQVKYIADEGEFHGRDLLEAVFSTPGGWVVAGAKRANVCSLWSFNTKMLPFVTINIYNWKDEWQMDDTLKIWKKHNRNTSTSILTSSRANHRLDVQNLANNGINCLKTLNPGCLMTGSLFHGLWNTPYIFG